MLIKNNEKNLKQISPKKEDLPYFDWTWKGYSTGWYLHGSMALKEKELVIFDPGEHQIILSFQLSLQLYLTIFHLLQIISQNQR